MVNGKNNIKRISRNFYGKASEDMLDKIFLFLLIVGGINWGLVGIFQFDLVAFIFGGSSSVLSRIIYVLVAISAIWCVSLFFRNNELVEETRTEM